jgi:hypothetical protein
MFQLNETKEQYLQFGVSLQKSSHADSYKVNPSLLIRSPFLESSGQELFLLANLRGDGIHLHVRTESWWPAESLHMALEKLKRFAIPWFREWGRPAFLAEKTEMAIRERKNLIDVFEPLDSEQKAAIARAWPLPADTETRVPAKTFFYAAILHYLTGNKEMATTRTKDWLERVSPENKAEKDKAQAQLTSLERSR